ncbi:MAG: hypothetical protein L3K09_08885 [Thermoplasmata archaeon]|nr:hypothetical protein [Thermoplasmata archaeon]
MLMALVLLAAIDAVPSPTVSLTLTGETDRPPVSATPRSLSDVARELREGRKAVGNFSAVESTVPQSLSTFIPTFEQEPDTTEPQPEVVTETPPVYVPAYPPVWYGGRPSSGRFHQRTAAHFAAPRAVPPAFQLRHTTAGLLRQR